MTSNSSSVPSVRRKPLSATSPPPMPSPIYSNPNSAASTPVALSATHQPSKVVDMSSRSSQTSTHTGRSLDHSPTTSSTRPADMSSISIPSSDDHPTAPTATSSPSADSTTLAKFESTSPRKSSWNSPSEPSDGSPKQGKLQKGSSRQSRRRSKSLGQQRKPNISVVTQPDLPSNPTSPMPSLRGRRSFSAQTPSIVTTSDAPPPPAVLQTRTATGSSQSPPRGRFRKSWFPGGLRSRSNSADPAKKRRSYAWVMSDDNAQADYNTSFLKNGEKVPELWNENGDVLVYLYPRGSGCGPSFKVPEFTITSSYVFCELIRSELEGPAFDRGRARSFGPADNLNAHDASRNSSPPLSPTGAEPLSCMRLYLPAAPPTGSGHLTAPREGSDAELDRLIAIRNLFAFLTGQPLVATRSKPSMFKAFIDIADLLQEFGYSGGEETFGDAVNLSFNFYLDQLGLSDCRHSREKTLEALVLGERMRYLDLYSEAFAHAAGKYTAIMELRLPLFEQVSPYTREKLERAHLDLLNRQHNVNEHLEQFEFPSLFAGIANSTSIPELRQVRFKVWRNSFNRMRHFTLSYYKHAFGSWPPKASSKKNPFAESGLNRLVLKALYSDMSALYDLLVDRNNLTSRVMDEVPAISEAADKMAMSALRNILSEFDRSKPPVLPPVPYDVPQLPSMTAIHETFNSLSAKVQNRYEKSIKEHELLLVLNKAYNYDTNKNKLPFLQHFKDFEASEGRGKLCQDLVDQRIGYWIFLYVVLQSLPMLVVDAPGLTHSEGVEYFLCEPPMGNPPWVEDKQVRKMWYEVTGGGGRLVELSADAVMFSVEATYHRSHCWLAAQKWQGIENDDGPPPEEQIMSPLVPPRGVFPSCDDFVSRSPPTASGTPSPPPGTSHSSLRPRTLSPGLNRTSQAWRSSIAIGLEPVPMEPPNIFGGAHSRSSSMGPRPMSSHVGLRSSSTGNLGGFGMSTASLHTQELNTGATFDDILGAPEPPPKPTSVANKKKSRFF
ncbi:hypothetical protein HIM_07133 [Hirsutella minnesotensis 3608]|uniref:DUF8004 domain-containing protein n=1 Tax=Hirsutella minnesotensis 3608 TaxID=1043627 RepID=A0A0F7ZZ44_9HYPO|nr:hypothetical protein HIM_07133 [Hirsutella minnesotensis 3608]